MFLFGLLLVEDHSNVLVLIHSCITTAYLIFTLILIVTQIFGTGKMTTQKIAGGIAAYIIIGHLWTILYVTTYQLAPESFQISNGSIEPDDALRQLRHQSRLWCGKCAPANAARIEIGFVQGDERKHQEERQQNYRDDLD